MTTNDIDPTNPTGLSLIDLTDAQLEFTINARVQEVEKARAALDRALRVRDEREMDKFVQR